MATDQSRSRSQIEADLAAIRGRLAANLETLIGEVHPTNVKQRQVAQVKQFAQSEFTNAKAQIKDENGWRLDRVALVGGAVAGAVALMVALKAIMKAASKGA